MKKVYLRHKEKNEKLSYMYQNQTFIVVIDILSILPIIEISLSSKEDTNNDEPLISIIIFLEEDTLI